MVEQQTVEAPGSCPKCGHVLTAETVRTAIWLSDRVVIVEDIPANLCSVCMEQFYEPDVSEALRRLSDDGFPEESAIRTIQVPVFSLEGRVKPTAMVSEDSYADY